MFAKLGLQNFKSFKDLNDIDIKPLTLLVGGNSCGKSTIIQSLLLLKQTLQDNQSRDALLLNGDYVKYSSLNEIAYGMPNKGQAEIVYSISLDNGKNVDLGCMKIYFKQHILKSQDRIERVYVKRIEYYRDNKLLAEIKHVKGNMYHVPRKYFNKSMLSSYKGFPFKIWDGVVVLDRFIPKEIRFRVKTKPGETSTASVDFGFSLNMIDSHIDRYVIHLIEELKNMSYLGPLRANPKRGYINYSISDMTLSADGANSPYILWLRRNRKVNYLDQFDKDLLVGVNAYLKLLGLNQSINIRNLEKIFFQMMLPIDGNDKKKVTLPDVGFGYSQLLPIVIQSLLSAKNSTTIFEQPEIHLHPNCQARLADLFVDMVKHEKNVIIETHSVDLINKLRLLVVQNPELVDKVSVYFIEQRDDNGSHAIPLKINKDGGFDNYPKGFCDEAEHLADQIIEARINRRQK